MRKKEALFLFTMGGLAYCGLELLSRKRTHWSMGVAGGSCLVALYAWEQRLKHRRWPVKCLVGSLTITTVELLIGLFVNRIMRWSVWDYSHQRGNLLGQICPRYSFLWFLLCIPVYPLCALFRRGFGLYGRIHG